MMAGITLCMNQVSINNNKVELGGKFKYLGERITHNSKEK